MGRVLHLGDEQRTVLLSTPFFGVVLSEKNAFVALDLKSIQVHT